jgi:hypothetical protein
VFPPEACNRETGRAGDAPREGDLVPDWADRVKRIVVSKAYD